MNLSSSEVFCFGISTPDDPLHITDLWIPKQKVTMASAELDEDDLAERIEQMSQFMPIQSFLRVWLHTHPGNDPSPSSVDINTLSTIFRNYEWTYMGILAQGGKFHSEIAWWGPDKQSQLRVKIPHEIDWTSSFKAAAPSQWVEEYRLNVEDSSAFETTLFDPNEPMGGSLTPEEQGELMYLTEMWEKSDPNLTDEMLERLDELEQLEGISDLEVDEAGEDSNGNPDHHYWANI
jgi:hypothetical protein